MNFLELAAILQCLAIDVNKPLKGDIFHVVLLCYSATRTMIRRKDIRSIPRSKDVMLRIPVKLCISFENDTEKCSRVQSLCETGAKKTHEKILQVLKSIKIDVVFIDLEANDNKIILLTMSPLKHRSRDRQQR